MPHKENIINKWKSNVRIHGLDDNSFADSIKEVQDKHNSFSMLHNNEEMVHNIDKKNKENEESNDYINESNEDKEMKKNGKK